MGRIDICYLGTSAFLITSEKGKTILTDPCLRGHEGKGVSPVSVESISHVDVILVSHGAADHLGDSAEIALRTGCDVICGPDVGYHLLKKGLKEQQLRRLVWGMAIKYRGLTVRCVESRHLSFFQTEGQLISGIPLGFILYMESGLPIYHPGDTSIFGDVRLFAELYRPEVGMLPIGGFADFPGELSPEEAALVAKWMKLKMVIPMHYPPGSELPQEFAEALRRESPATRLVTLNPGETASYQQP